MAVFPNRVPNLQQVGPIIEIIILPPQPVYDSLRALGKPILQKKVIALIDTGASGSCINNDIATELGLIVRNSVTVGTPAGPTKQDLYDAGIALPNLTRNIFPVTVCGANLGGQPYAALLGRDILSQCTLIYNGWDNSYQLHI